MRGAGVIGIDIGGTKIRGVLVKNGRVLKTLKFKTPKNRKTFLDKLGRLYKNLAIENHLKIGIGVAGVISGNKVVVSPNIPYLKNFNFSDILPKSKIKVDNDARAQLRGNLGRSREKTLLITLGTGIGRAFAKDNKVLPIKKFEYPERWEKEYQKIRRRHNEPTLINLLSKKLLPIVKKTHPKRIILGGGVFKRKKFLGELCRSLNNAGVRADFKISKRKSGAIGAGLLHK